MLVAENPCVSFRCERKDRMFHARHIVFRDRIEYVANEEIVVGVEQMKVKPLAEFTIRKTVPSDRRQ